MVDLNPLRLKVLKISVWVMLSNELRWGVAGVENLFVLRTYYTTSRFGGEVSFPSSRSTTNFSLMLWYLLPSYLTLQSRVMEKNNKKKLNLGVVIGAIRKHVFACRFSAFLADPSRIQQFVYSGDPDHLSSHSRCNF